ncbi:MAG: hypothetical protein Q3983_03540 [Capnocytophaga sp.]|nr:hypothetical protein [Capnocytophaga sp.]
MKKLSILTFCSLLFLSCNSNKNKPQMNENEPLIGGQTDKHGCLISAGQTWSELLQNCIQVFNEGTRLNPLDVKGNDAVISAFVVFNSEKNKAELFLPSDEENVILEQTESHIYQKGKYTYNDVEKQLYIDGKITYKGE